MIQRKEEGVGDDEFKPPRPGIEYKNGKLYDFQKDRILVIQSWPDPRAWVKLPGQGWKGDRRFADEFVSSRMKEAFDPEPAPDLDSYRLPGWTLSKLAQQKASPKRIEAERVASWNRAMRAWRVNNEKVRPFFAAIPAEIRDLLAPFDQRAWHLLCLFARCPGALDLYRANPALAFALAGHWYYRENPVQNPLRASRRLVWRKQRDILAWMGFPGTEPARRIFRKIDVAEIRPSDLAALKVTLKDPERVKCLSHLPVITEPVLRLVNTPESLTAVTPRFLHDMLADPVRARWVRVCLRDSIEMNRQLGGGHLPAKFHSLDTLCELHDKLGCLVRDFLKGDGSMLPHEFPEPPYAGTDDIQPVRTLADLVREGQDMHHCVAMYARYIAAGNVYVYRVNAPVRATMAISWYKGQWMLREIQGVANSLISAVDRWFIEDTLFDCYCNRVGSSNEQQYDDEEEPGAELVPEELKDISPAPENPGLGPGIPHDENGVPVEVAAGSAGEGVNRVLRYFAKHALVVNEV